ncbi:hypothetical protein KC19_4G203500 [Ceratodon purpureus]|uniref:Uncharacterized protein n=1 Tax=Ceratodon purpureus TaxID=3225 RepID=A0A8T0ICY1_CERPU|nr:hypothetical protein KC19_4G203500 [Ceratodon purpureus]
MTESDSITSDMENRISNHKNREHRSAKKAVWCLSMNFLCAYAMKTQHVRLPTHNLQLESPAPTGPRRKTLAFPTSENHCKLSAPLQDLPEEFQVFSCEFITIDLQRCHRLCTLGSLVSLITTVCTIVSLPWLPALVPAPV